MWFNTIKDKNKGVAVRNTLIYCVFYSFDMLN